MKEYNLKKKHYNSIDGLRALACLGIILMHIEANTEYRLNGSFLFDRCIPSLTWLVYLFFIISGFGMCAGYLEKFWKGTIDLETFYKKRYRKILPFFGLLLLIAFVLEHSVSALYEISIEVLLLHGLLPNNAVSVIGVCWFLGVVFLFYLLFPAFSVLMKTKKRAWMSLFISLWIVFACDKYFFSNYFVTNSFTPRHNFLYCLPLFIGGGLVYLYREEITFACEKYRWLLLVVCLAVSVAWYLIPYSQKMLFYCGTLLLYCLWLSYAIGSDSKFLSLKPMRFLSSISMEMYLAQMIVFRVVEKLHFLYIFGNAGIGGWASFLLAFVLTVAGLICFIECYRFAVRFLGNRKEYSVGKTRTNHKRDSTNIA